MDFNLIFIAFGLIIVFGLLWAAVDQIPPDHPVHRFIWVLRVLLLLMAAVAIWNIFGLGRRFADTGLIMLT